MVYGSGSSRFVVRPIPQTGSSLREAYGSLSAFRARLFIERSARRKDRGGRIAGEGGQE